MKTTINKLSILLSIALVLACADDSLDPFRFDEVKKGSLLALRGDAVTELNNTGCSNFFFKDQIGGDEVFTFDADFLSEDQSLLSEVRTFVKSDPVDPEADPDLVKARVQVSTTPGSNFTIPDGGKYKAGKVSVSLSAIQTALGFTDAQMARLGKFDVTIEQDLVLTDGTTVSADVIVNNGLFQSAIFFPAHRLTYCAINVEEAKSNATVSFRGQVGPKNSAGVPTRFVIPLKGTAKDTLRIVFDQNIIDPPTITLSGNGTDNGILGPVTVSKKINSKGNYTADDDPKAFFAVYEAPVGYTGVIKAKVADATSEVAGVVLVQNEKTFNINVDNQIPQQTDLSVAQSSTIGNRIGRSQFTTIKVSFNEKMSTESANKLKITVTGQGLDDVTNADMTIASDGLSASYIYVYKDSDNPTDVTHGDLNITITGGTDLARNAYVGANTVLLCDVGVPDAAVIVPDAGQYDYGTQIKWTVTQAAGINNPGGSNRGTVFYVVLPSGTQAPSQKTKTIQGATGFFDGFTYPAWDETTTYSAGDRVSVGNDFWESKVGGNLDITPEEGDDWKKVTLTVRSSPLGSGVFVDFPENGTNLEVYHYFVNLTGNVSANAGPVVVTMQ